jgi:hypothetical protein
VWIVVTQTYLISNLLECGLLLLKPASSKNELPPKNKNKQINKCPGTRSQGCGVLVPWYQGSHLNMRIPVRFTHNSPSQIVTGDPHGTTQVFYYETIKREKKIKDSGCPLINGDSCTPRERKSTDDMG